MARYTDISVRYLRLIVITNSFLGLLMVSGLVKAQEPTESEMCGALEAKFAAINQSLQQVQQQCEKRAYENDPFLAMRCLAQYSASGGSGKLSVKMTRCEKIACVKASNQAGYVCDYMTGIDMPGNVAMSESLGAMFSNGGTGMGRFVQAKNGWLFMPLGQ